MTTDNGSFEWPPSGGANEPTFADSLVNNAGTVTLVGDTATPGDSKYYGTNSGGTLGYYSLPAGSGTVTSVSVASANGFAGSVATATTTPAITISTSITGLLQGNGTAISAATTGNLTEATSSVLTISGGSGAVLGSGTSIQVKQASASVSGYLSSTDWSTFNSKQAALTFADSLVNTGGTVTLVNDDIAPNANMFYGTNGSGTKGWFPYSDSGAITQLTGDISATGPGSVNATIEATTNNTLATLSALIVASSLGEVGTITNGTWQADPVEVSYGGSGVDSFTAYMPICGGDSSTGALQSVGNSATAGQVLTYVNSSSVPTWQTPSFTVPTQQTFASSGTYTPTSSNVLYVKVTVVGSGGGGGGSNATGGSGGGGAGGSTIGYLPYSSISSGITVTVGNGGGGGNSSGIDGSSGGTVSFGSLSATGGAGGHGAGSATGTMGGAGGVGSGGTVNFTGNAGNGGSIGTAATTNGCGGNGGGSFFGGAGIGNFNAAGGGGTAYGGGGGGCSNGNAGGTGFKGFVLVEEFYS